MNIKHALQTRPVLSSLAITILATGAISPHIVFAPSIAACPLRLKSFIDSAIFENCRKITKYLSNTYAINDRHSNTRTLA